MFTWLANDLGIGIFGDLLSSIVHKSFILTVSLLVLGQMSPNSEYAATERCNCESMLYHRVIAKFLREILGTIAIWSDSMPRRSSTPEVAWILEGPYAAEPEGRMLSINVKLLRTIEEIVRLVRGTTILHSQY